MERERVCVPPPHVAVHGENGEKSVTAQCTGHGPKSHVLASVDAPQGAPPCMLGTRTVRMRECVPAAHDAEHSPHIVHIDITQSTGQLCALHARVADSDGHA